MNAVYFFLNAETKTADVKETIFDKKLSPKEASMADILKTPYYTQNMVNDQAYSQNFQGLVDSYDYFTRIHPLPQEYPDYSNFKFPGNNNYDFLDVNDNLVYDLTAAAAASSQDSDVSKDWLMDPELRKDAAALFFPDGLLAFSTLADDKNNELEEVIIKGSQSLKPDSKLLSENLKLENFEEDVHMSTVSSTNEEYPSEETTTPLSLSTSFSEDDTPSSTVAVDNGISEGGNDSSPSITTLSSELPTPQENSTDEAEYRTVSIDENDMLVSFNLTGRTENTTTTTIVVTSQTPTTSPSTTTTTADEQTGVQVNDTFVFTTANIAEEPQDGSNATDKSEQKTKLNDEADEKPSVTGKPTDNANATDEPEHKTTSTYESKDTESKSKLDVLDVKGNFSDNKVTIRAELFHSLRIQLPESESEAESDNNTQRNATSNQESAQAEEVVFKATQNISKPVNETVVPLNTTAAQLNLTTSAVTMSPTLNTTEQAGEETELMSTEPSANQTESEMTTGSVATSTSTPKTSSAPVTSSSVTTETTPSVVIEVTDSVHNATSQKDASYDIVDTAPLDLTEVNATANASTDTLPINANSTGTNTTLISEKNNTVDSSEQSADTTTASIDLQTMSQSETTVTSTSSEAKSETTTPQTTTAAPLKESTTQFLTAKLEWMQPEGSETSEPETEIDYKPELQWWKPISQSAKRYYAKTSTDDEAENAEDSNSIVSMEPFTRWAGTEVEDKWPAMKSRLASAPGSASYNKRIARTRVFGNKGSNYNSFMVDLRQDHTHEPRWYDYVNARHGSRPSRKEASITTTLTVNPSPSKDRSDDRKDAPSPKRKDSDSKFRSTFSYRYHPSPSRWSPFSPQLVVPNLGTLWGLNPDPRLPRYEGKLLKHQKLNDQGSPSRSKYIYPDASRPKLDDSEGSTSGQKEVTYKVKAGGPTVSKLALNHLGLQQKTILSEIMPSSDRSRPRYKGE